MKVTLYSPWDNAWVPHYRKAFAERGCVFEHVKDASHRKCDVAVHGWATGATPLCGDRNIVFMRRFEYFDGLWTKVNWSLVDALIVVNSFIKSKVEEHFQEAGIKTPVHLVYNSVDLDKWKLRTLPPSKNVGMACFIHPKKNLPLALQIMANLPEGYALHIAGAVQDIATAEYLDHMASGLQIKTYIYGQIPDRDMPLWWEQMGFCLSTSISEGNPNNVNEAMAKGVTPIVHRWPGAEDQYPEDCLFATAQEATDMIAGWRHDPNGYRKIVQEKFSLENVERVVDLAVG